MQTRDATNRYRAALGERTFADLQGVKLKTSNIMQPAKRWCLLTGQMYLKRACLLDLLAPSAQTDYLNPDRISQYEERERTLDWLATLALPHSADSLNDMVQLTQVESVSASLPTSSANPAASESDVAAAVSAATKALKGLIWICHLDKCPCNTLYGKLDLAQLAPG